MNQDKWYHAEKGEAHDKLIAVVSAIASNNSLRRDWDAKFAKMYATDPTGVGEEPKELRERLRFNICRSVVNTGKAHIGSKRPRPRFQTNDGDWDTVKKARGCEAVVDGEFRRSGFHEMAPMIFVDGAVSSIGGVKVYTMDGHIQMDRVFPGEMHVDAREGYYGKPRNIYQVKKIPADALKAQLRTHPQFKRISKSIDLAATSSETTSDEFEFLDIDQAETELVTVFEGWHLPDLHDDGTDRDRKGRHVIAIANDTLTHNRWDRDTFPFAWWRWEKRQFGWYGMGMVEEVRPYQRGLNFLDGRITDILQRVSRAYTVVTENSGVEARHLDNDPTTVITVKGSLGEAPRIMSSNAVPTEMFSRRQEIISDAYREVGFSEMMATGTKPTGLDSGAAQREFKDTASQRFTDKMNAWDQFFLDAAKLVIEEKSDISAEDEKPVQIKRRKGSSWVVEEIKWSDFSFSEEQYMLEVTPSSLLPDSSSGRIQTATDWFKAGIINQVEFKALLSVPDLDRFKSMDLATYEIVLDTIENIIEDGDYDPPEPTDDLDLVIRLVTQSLAKYRLRHAPEDRLDLLRNYLTDALDMQTPPPPAAEVPGAVPGAVQPEQAPQPVEAPQGAGGPAELAVV